MHLIEGGGGKYDGPGGLGSAATADSVGIAGDSKSDQRDRE